MSQKTTRRFDTLSFFEFWPGWLFYIPLKIYGVWLTIRYGGLTLPTIANPLFEVGGYVGESKTQLMDQIPASLAPIVAQYTTVKRTGEDDNTLEADMAAAKAAMTAKGIVYPIVAKPDIGCRGMGVWRIFNDDDLRAYLRLYPAGESMMLQTLHDFPHEVGLFYIRHPDWDKGFIFSLTEKHFASVTGDGVTALKDLILNHPRAGKIAHIYLERHKDKLDYVVPAGEKYRIAFAGSHSRGTIFKNGADLITPTMNETWDRISKQIPEFYFGRFDVRYNTIEDVKKGENCKIVEVNGASAEATHIWDSDTTLLEAYKVLFKQYNHLFAIGSKNKKRGFKPLTWKEVQFYIKRHEDLQGKYPGTH